MNNICCKCGSVVESWFHGQGFICEICKFWGIERKDVFPTIEDVFDEQFHRIGKNGSRYWGKRGAGIVFTDGDNVLLLKRRSPSDHPGSWAIPGGKAKVNELPIDTAWRETQEETGQDRTGQRVTNFLEKDGLHRFMVYLYRISDQFDVDLSKEHSDWKWIPLEEVEDYDLHPKFKRCWHAYRNAIDSKVPSKTRKFSEWLTERKDIDA